MQSAQISPETLMEMSDAKLMPDNFKEAQEDLLESSRGSTANDVIFQVTEIGCGDPQELTELLMKQTSLELTSQMQVFPGTSDKIKRELLLPAGYESIHELRKEFNDQKNSKFEEQASSRKLGAVLGNYVS